MQKIINFIKFHNAFAIGLILIFVFSGAIFASEDFHDAVIGEEITTQTGIDNAQLLATDLESFDLDLRIDNVLEDEENYYIDYSFNTLGIKDNTWRLLVKRATMTVSKAALGDKDLGLYVTEELGEVADYELAYLKEVQTAEKEKGKTEIVETREYTGLVGMVLDIKNKVLPGYEPVVEPPVSDMQEDSTQSMEPIDEYDEFLGASEEEKDYPEDSPYYQWLLENKKVEEEGEIEETEEIEEAEEAVEEVEEVEEEVEDQGDQEEEEKDLLEGEEIESEEDGSDEEEKLEEPIDEETSQEDEELVEGDYPEDSAYYEGLEENGEEEGIQD